MTVVDAERRTAASTLVREALSRLARNRGAMASVIVLVVVTLACLIGPNLTGHDYARVYQDYVRVPSSLELHPSPDKAMQVLSRLAGRLRATPSGTVVGPHSLRTTLTGQRPIADADLVVFERSDLFKMPRALERSGDGRILVIEVPIEHHRFLLGTDQNGRDLLTRTLIAGRVSLAIGLVATLVALLIGVTWGAAAGYAGGRIDQVMMRIVDILYALPFIFFVIVLVVMFGRNFVLMFLAVGCIEWLDMARIVRGQTLSIRRQEYVEAAEALGVGPVGILKRHIIPNVSGPVVVYTTLMVPRVILLESFLSFLGLGVQEPMTSWGVLIAEGARGVEAAPHLLVWPAAALVATLLALNFLGDGLRDALDPRDR